MLTLAAAIAIVGLVTTKAPPLFPTLLFGATMVAAEHRDRLFGDETSVSGGIAVAMATVLVFAHGSWLTGPMICAGFAGCYWPHLRTRAWSRVAVNTAAMSLAAGSSAGIVHLLITTNNFGARLALAGVAALGTFWAVNSAVLAVAVSSIHQSRLPATIWHLVRSDLRLLPFGLMGFLTGLLARGGVVDVWLALLGVLVLLDRVVIDAPERISTGSLLASTTLIAVTVAGIALAMTNEPTMTATLPLLCAGGLVVFWSVDALGHSVGFAVGAAFAAATAIAMQGTQPIAGPLLVGVTACLPELVLRPTVRGTARAWTAAVVASLSIGVTAVSFGHIGSSVSAAVIFGLVAVAMASVLWHATQTAWLILERKRHLFRSAVDVFVADAPMSIVAGVMGGVAGWGCVRANASDVVLAAVLACVAFGLVGALLRSRIRARLVGENLLDVVRSAVLGLPASRLPKEIPER